MTYLEGVGESNNNTDFGFLSLQMLSSEFQCVFTFAEMFKSYIAKQFLNKCAKILHIMHTSNFIQRYVSNSFCWLQSTLNDSLSWFQLY